MPGIRNLPYALVRTSYLILQGGGNPPPGSARDLLCLSCPDLSCPPPSLPLPSLYMSHLLLHRMRGRTLESGARLRITPSRPFPAFPQPSSLPRLSLLPLLIEINIAHGHVHGRNNGTIGHETPVSDYPHISSLCLSVCGCHAIVD